MSSNNNTTIVGSFTKEQRVGVAALAAVIALGVIGLQAFIDPLRRQPAIEPPNVNKTLGPIGRAGAALPFEYTLGALTGFREVIAGMLWVRSDTFFHEGNYDAILPCIRLITWLDPNWLDPYATGAWHMMYNFTDTQQRSDRRYIPAGLALLKEGIANNPNQYDMYEEMAWNNFDKVKDFESATDYSVLGMQNDPHFDINRLEHMLAHSYEHTGRIDKAIATWADIAKRHQAIINDPNSSGDDRSRNLQGFRDAIKQLFLDKVRAAHRPTQTQPPVDVQFTARVERLSPKILEISGHWNLVGAHLYDAGPAVSDRMTLDEALHNSQFGKGIVSQGPVDGARVDVRLQDAGYVPQPASEFSFDVDPSVTIMQDSISTRGGKGLEKGGVFVWYGPKKASLIDMTAENAGVYAFDDTDGREPGIPLDRAMAGGAPVSPLGELQLAAIAREPFDQLKKDPGKIGELTMQGYCIATTSRYTFGTFKRDIDMSQDPKMYGFQKDKYDLILTLNPRTAPEFVQDRIGWQGEGWTDRRYLDIVKSPDADVPPIRMIRQQIELTRDDIVGTGWKLLADDGPSH
jgi:hypothetical protein